MKQRMRVEEVTAARQDFMEYLRRDPVRNAFALYDLTEEADRVQCHAASREGRFRGYLLEWYGGLHANVILEGTEEAARALLPRAPQDRCTFLVNPGIGQVVMGLRRVDAVYPMDVMVLDARRARLREVPRARRLGRGDAGALAALYEEAGPSRGRDLGEWIARGIAYGIFEGSRLVAAAGTHVLSRDLCLIGGVYTAEDRRRRGYGAEVVSAVSSEALRKVPAVSLLVVSSNLPAIRLYESLGFRKAMEWLWMDVGTGHVPLM